MKRAVPDTNILVSALLFGGSPQVFLQAPLERPFQPITSAALLDELEDVLRRKFRQPEREITAIRHRLENLLELVSVALSISAVPEDPDDNRVLECAVAGRADYIVSGDKHLLSLGQYQGIRILKLRQFLDILSPPA